MREIAEQVLRAAQLTYRIGSRPLVSEIDFALRSGEVVAMLGPNGAGKSTILKLLCGQLRPSSGTVIFGDNRFSNGRRESLPGAARCCLNMGWCLSSFPPWRSFCSADPRMVTGEAAWPWPLRRWNGPNAGTSPNA